MFLITKSKCSLCTSTTTCPWTTQSIHPNTAGDVISKQFGMASMTSFLYPEQVNTFKQHPCLFNVDWSWKQPALQKHTYILWTHPCSSKQYLSLFLKNLHYKDDEFAMFHHLLHCLNPSFDQNMFQYCSSPIMTLTQPPKSANTFSPRLKVSMLVPRASLSLTSCL